MIAKENFRVQLSEICKDYEEKTFLLAVSGGADSMVMATLFHSLGLSFQMAHVNYHLRGTDSDRDEKIVKDFCNKNDVPLHLYHVSEMDKKPENSIELWARNIRYRFFREILEKEQLDCIATAHHLNDQLETFLINLSRGSGIRGLSGIPANNNQILRPMLHFSKKEIYDFAERHHIQFGEDYTNSENDFLRNKIRNDIVPKLLKTNNHFLENFEKSIRFLDEAKRFLEENSEKIFNEISVLENEKIILDKKLLQKQNKIVQFEILRKFGFDDEREIQKIFKAGTGKIFLSEEYELLVNRNLLELKKKTQKKEKKNETIIIAEKAEDFPVQLSAYTGLRFENKTWVFNCKKLIFPLKLRHHKTGDKIFPIGMIGKKSVSKFFKDEKISTFDKPKIWLLCDGNDQILGIVPFRQDRRYAANETAENALIIQL